MNAVSKAVIVKVRLRNVGEGFLELIDDRIKFYVETGHFRKQRKILREIQFADVESIERQGNDLHVIWKDNTEMFAFEQQSQLEAIRERITMAFKERKKEQETEETANQEWKELAQMMTSAMETVGSLFDILENFHGRVNWKLVEDNLLRFEESAGALSSQGADPVCLGIKPISVAVRQRRPEEIGEKAYDILRELYDHFNGLVSSVQDSGQSHPNRRDAKLFIQAIYVLNDMSLGAVIGDEAVGKEGAELFKALEDLAKLPGSQIDVNAVKASLDNSCAEKERQRSVMGEIKSTLEKKLKEQVMAAAGNFQHKC
jgi:hypothetical protein